MYTSVTVHGVAFLSPVPPIIWKMAMQDPQNAIITFYT